jgi:hypothetical protein
MAKKIRATYKILDTIDLNQIENYSITDKQWTWLYKNRNFSEDFIEKFQDKVNWSYISCRQVLSKEFIDKFQDKVNWFFIAYSQDLSDKFVNKYRDRLDIEKVNERRNKRIREALENALK